MSACVSHGSVYNAFRAMALMVIPYVQQNLLAGTPQGDIMKTLAKQWHDEKDKGQGAKVVERTPMRQLDLSDLSLQ